MIHEIARLRLQVVVIGDSLMLLIDSSGMCLRLEPIPVHLAFAILKRNLFLHILIFPRQRPQVGTASDEERRRLLQQLLRKFAAQLRPKHFGLQSFCLYLQL